MVNPFGNAQGSYVPPAPGGMAPPPMTGGAPMPYGTPDQYMGPPMPGAPMPGAPNARPAGPNLLMVGGLALGGFLLFGPIGAIIGGVIGLMMK